jgi:hypothetical protein
MNNHTSATGAQHGQFTDISELLASAKDAEVQTSIQQQRTKQADTPQTPDKEAAEKNDERKKEDEFDGMTDDEIKNVVDSQIYNRPETGFPAPMRKEAFRGVVGKVIDLATENSELCREAVLVQLLVAFGNMLGRGPWMWQEATHFCNEFAAIVGKTSGGAKGGSLRSVKELLAAIDAEYVDAKFHGGYQSGEAVVEAIRDECEIIKENGQIETIEGIPDKRLLITEEEFSRILKIGARQGSILSEMLRMAFDSGNKLIARSKKHPAEASYPHISMIGHITPHELKECMKNADIYNGFANRVLWCASRRSGKVPRPKFVAWTKYPEIIVKFRAALNGFAPRRSMTIRREEQINFDERSFEVWDDFYIQNETEAENTGGVLGGVIARGKAHVLRLSMIYAIIDGSATILPQHIDSAIAVWEYCKASAAWAFGDNSGNPLADRILWLLKSYPNGMTRTEISNQLNRNVGTVDIEQALSELRKSGMADFRCVSELDPVTKKIKKGRKAEQWFCLS